MAHVEARLARARRAAAGASWAAIALAVWALFGPGPPAAVLALLAMSPLAAIALAAGGLIRLGFGRGAGPPGLAPAFVLPPLVLWRASRRRRSGAPAP